MIADQVRYEDALPGTTVEYRVGADVLSEAVILRDARAIQPLVFDLRASENVSAHRNADGRIEFRDSGGRRLYDLAPPYAYSTAGGAPRPVPSRLAKTDGGWVLTLVPDQAWLSEAVRSGPVVVDPTVVFAGAQRDCTIENDLPNSNLCDLERLWVGFHDDHTHHALVRFDVEGAIPRDAVIADADFGLWLDSQSHPTVSKEVGIYRVTRPWTTPTWNEADPGVPWTSPGGDVDPTPAATTFVPTNFRADWVSWFPLDLVQGWVDGSHPNHGLLIKDLVPGATNEYKFMSTEGGGEPKGPELDIVWRPRFGLIVRGDLRYRPIQATSGDTYPLNIEARDATTSMQDVRILIDGIEEERFAKDPDCTSLCPVIVDDFAFDTDWVSEGHHTITVIARNDRGEEIRDEWTINVPRENHFASMLGVWRGTIERRVDDEDPAPLTARIPKPPADWRTPESCDVSADQLRACYDRVTQWGSAMQTWLADNLPEDSFAAELPEPPTFEYSLEEGTARDLTRRLRDAFVLARHNVANPSGAIDVAVGFHRPLTPAEVRASVPATARLHDQSALTGAFDPTDGSWQGTVRVSTPSSLDVSMEDFYLRQNEIVTSNIEELENETPENEEEAEDIQATLAQARAFKANLDARGSFITGVTVRLQPAEAARVLTTSPSEIKSIAPLPPGAAPASAGMDALSTMSVDAVTVHQSRATAPRGAETQASPAQPTCAERGEEGRIPRSVLAVNPVYYAPSRFKADTVFGEPDGGHHLKVHRLRFRWQAAFGLAWMCADRPGDRNIEMEAMVYPEDPRWSDNWETNNARKYTQTNMPGNLHQDDIASGDFPGYPFDKSKYPDFAILAQSSRNFQYRKLYFVNFTTNEGNTDQGRVIYSSQATHRAASSREKTYCGLFRASDYKSCMFSKVETCYAHAFISEAPVYRRIDWSERLGFLSRLEQVGRQHPDIVKRGGDPTTPFRKVTALCDPRPAS